MTAPATWHAEPTDHAALDLTGPGIDDLVHSVVMTLAEAVHNGDAVADRWSDYRITYANLANAKEYGVENFGLDELEDAVANAWDALVLDLPNAVRLHMAEARLVAGKLDEEAGRIGLVAA